MALAIVAALLAATAYAPPRSGAAQVDDYRDVVPDSFAAEHIATLAAVGTFEGTECAPGRFCPGDPLPRWVMAVWVVRILDGRDPPERDSRFADVDAGSWWARHVARFDELGVTRGCRDGTIFCPDATVTRAEMAVFIARAFSLDDRPDPGFSDVPSDAWYAPDVARLATSGITKGCGDGTRFCPDERTTRAQMATLLSRAVSLRTAAPSVRVDSLSPPVVQGGFEVTITFSAPVAGFELDDVWVANGAATHLSGDGADYRATIEPAADGTVVVRVPESSARAAGGASNASSGILVRTRAEDSVTAIVGIDTWDRSAVLASYREEFEREEPDWGYSGDAGRCVAGTTSPAFRDSVLQRVNWYRHMAGLPAVTEDTALSATAQQKALIMLAQQSLSHSPTADWACYTEIDHPGENLGLGAAGVGGVDSYMRDSGDNNHAVGHRQQILSPFVTQIGTGNVRDSALRYETANAMHLAYAWDLVPTTREVRGFVAWPPPGYAPAKTVWGRWSFSRQHIGREVTRSGSTIHTKLFLSGPDFSQAVVAVSDDDGPVPTRIIHRDDALVWAVHGDTQSAQLPAPDDGDHCYTVSVSGVRIDGAVETPYEYAVCVLDPGA